MDFAPWNSNMLSEEQMDSSKWNIITNDIEMIFAGGFISGQHFIDIYTRAYEYCLSLTTQNEKLVSQNFNTNLNRSADVGEEFNNPCHHLYDMINDYIVKIVISKKREEIFKSPDRQLMRVYIEKWAEYKSGAQTLSSVYSYVTRVWCSDNLVSTDKDYVQKIYQLAILSWSKHLYRPCSERLYEIVFKMIDTDRRGALVNFDHVKILFQSLGELGPGDYIKGESKLLRRRNKIAKISDDSESKTIVGEDFSIRYVSILLGYCKNIVDNFFKQTSYTYSQYSNFVASLYRDEQHRCKSFFNQADAEKVINSMDKILITPTHNSIVNEFIQCIEMHNYESLINNYLLIKKVDTIHTAFKHAFTIYINTTIDTRLLQFMKDGVILRKNFFKAIKNLIHFYNYLYNIVMIFCGGSLDVRKLLASVLGLKLNSVKIEDNTPMTQAVCFYIHTKLCKWYEKNPEESTISDRLLKKFHDWILLVYFIDNKDSYLKAHGFYMAERAVDLQLKSVYAEKFFLDKLSAVLRGGETITEISFAIDLRKTVEDFTPYLHLRYYPDHNERLSSASASLSINNTAFMVSDVDIISHLGLILEDYTSQHSLYGDIAPAKSTQVDMVALSSIAWPYDPDGKLVLDHSKMKLPRIFQNVFNTFENKFNDKFPSRKLEVFHAKSTVIIDTGRLFDVNYEFKLTLPQACVLLRFNYTRNEYVSIGDIATRVNLSLSIILDVVTRFYELGLIEIQNKPKFQGNGDISEKLNLADNDMIRINTNFRSDNNCVTFVRYLELPNEKTRESLGNIAIDTGSQKYLIQSIVVGYIKHNKSIHKSEVAEFVRSKLASRFVPSNAFIQECCADLIDKEFMKETGSEAEFFIYIP